MPEQYDLKDTLIIARRAAWAGDVGYCRARLDDLHRLTRRKTVAADEWGPEALLVRAGNKLRTRIKGRESPPKELVLEFSHLRGVVWQTDSREFELLAFLTNNKWEDQLHRHAQIAAEHPGAQLLRVEDEETGAGQDGRQKELFPPGERAEPVDEGTGVAWEEDIRGLLCTVVVSELGLIKVKGVWLLKAMPQGSAEVVSRFEGILTRIEGLDPATVEPDLPDNEKLPS
jgi:hypothetical protein